MDTPIARAEHEEFRRRLEEENSRQDARLKAIETNFKEMQSLAASVASLAGSMERMTKEQERQGKRLEVLEGRDGEMWRKVVSYAVTAVVGALLGYIFTQLGI